jgi:hypothetical protein
MSQASWHALKCEAVQWRRAKNPARATECLMQALAITGQAADLIRETGTMQNYLADLYLQQGQLTLAESAIREALRNRFRLPVAEQTLAADDFIVLARILGKQGKHREAFDAASHGLAILRRQSGIDGRFLCQIQDMVNGLKRQLTRMEKHARISARNAREKNGQIRGAQSSSNEPAGTDSSPLD